MKAKTFVLRVSLLKAFFGKKLDDDCRADVFDLDNVVMFIHICFAFLFYKMKEKK